MITATWLGGPNDGEELMLPDTYPYVRFMDCVSDDWFRPDTEGPLEIETRTLEAPLCRTKTGWLIDYTKRRRV